MNAVILKPGKDFQIRGGHPWIFSGAIKTTSGAVQNGEVVRVLDADERFIGIGYYNAKSNITVRILSLTDVAIDRAFFEKKISSLRKLKERFLTPEVTNAYRVVYAESDGIPGLIVDKYADVLVLQAHTAGIDTLKPLIVEALVKLYAPRAIYERSDLGVRKLEGLDTQPTGLLHGELPAEPVEIHENGLKYLVDVVGGQKTGFFLDQRENRKAAAYYAKGLRCLNVFSYSGGFGVALTKAGATECLNLDSSESALALAEQNYRLNDLDASEHHFLQADAFEFLDQLQPGTFDFVILDPPAFTKSHRDGDVALKAYARLNALALRALPPGGLLATASCSGSVAEDDFFRSVAIAAQRTGTTIRLLEKRVQPIDHAVNAAFPEGAYLKFFIFEKA